MKICFIIASCFYVRGQRLRTVSVLFYYRVLRFLELLPA
jgi:hypothetical protein